MTTVMHNKKIRNIVSYVILVYIRFLTMLLLQLGQVYTCNYVI